jgi:HPt (histidine-containing phosphotransfer) domain-containing protein
MSHTAPESPQNTPAGPLVSTLANDPDMAELVQFFLEEIDDRIDTILSATHANDIAGLRTVAHQLKGAAAGYGFAPISDIAGELERLIDVTETLQVSDAIHKQVDELIALCQRAAA